jgi:ribosomal protein L19E
VRSQRKILSVLAAAKVLERANYRSVYLKVKGNSFKGKKNLINYLKENKMVSEDNLNKTLTPPTKSK